MIEVVEVRERPHKRITISLYEAIILIEDSNRDGKEKERILRKYGLSPSDLEEVRDAIRDAFRRGKIGVRCKSTKVESKGMDLLYFTHLLQSPAKKQEMYH